MQSACRYHRNRWSISEVVFPEANTRVALSDLFCAAMHGTRRASQALMHVQDLLQDVRHTIRSWRRDPVAALVLISVLSLGIGANTAIFAVVNGILFRPLPYPSAD